jgi:hypothetical protein
MHTTRTRTAGPGGARCQALRPGWREKILSRRYQDIVISSEEAAQVERLKYVLAHGVKEGLVEKVTDWPGVHCAQALMTGETVQG